MGSEVSGETGGEPDEPAGDAIASLRDPSGPSRITVRALLAFLAASGALIGALASLYAYFALHG